MLIMGTPQDHSDIAGAVREPLNLEVALIALVAPRTVPKTS